MANETGFTLIIDDKMLNKLDLADKKIEQLQKTSNKTSDAVISAFKQMTAGIDPFIDKLNEANGMLSKLKSPKISFEGFKGMATDGEKAAKAVADISVALNKAKSSPIDDLNKKIASLKDLLVQSTKAAEDYANKMSSIKSTGSGVISGATIKEGSAGKSLIPQIQAEIAALEQEKKSILSSQAMWTQRTETLNGSSLATQKQVADMAKLNDAFRNGQSEMQKQAKAQDDLAKAAERTAKSVEKQAAAEAKKTAQSQAKGDNAATRAVEQYNNALNKSEVTIANRARKIEALANAERALTQAGRAYSTEINKIRTETERLNKANTDAANSTDKIKSSHRGLMDTSGQLARQLALAFSVSQIEGYIMKLVTVRGEFELQQKALQAILQNEDETDKLFGQITDLAVRSPFRVKELVTYTKELAAYRVETSKLYDTTKMLADVSAGLGVDMSRLILAFGQVKAANYLRGTELRQFSEAGINILGELATYFTELEGQMVSVGDVFERVSKRMVSFGDVEEIFKRITSAGGIFYNMQEIQAETLQGQISNLYDSFDLMFNEIGKANDGVLKGTVSSIRIMVENWSILANLLKATSVGFVLYAAKVIIATAANKGFTASQIEATIASGGLSKGLAKAALGFKAIASFAKANPFILIATAMSAIVYGLIDHNKKVDEARAKYDILTDSLGRQGKEISKIVDEMKSQDDLLKSSSTAMSKFKEGTSEHTKAQSDNNDASKKRNLLLEELRTKHPQIYNGLVQQKDGTIDLTLAQQEYNKQLEQTNYLNFLASSTETFWSDGLVSNLSELAENQNKTTQQTNKLDAAWLQLTGRLKSYLDTNKYLSKDTKKQFEDIANSSLSISTKIEKLNSLARTTHAANIGDLRRMLYEYIDGARNFTNANNALGKSQEAISSQVKSIANDAKLAFNLSSEEGRRRAAETLRIFIESLGVQEQSVKDFITQRFEIEIGVKIATAPVVEQYVGMQKRIKDYVEKNKLSIDIIKADQSSSEYFGKLNADLKDTEDYINRLNIATEQLDTTMSNEKVLEIQKKKQAELKTTLLAFGEYSTKTGKDALVILNERISLIKEANKEYENGLKYYDKEAAKLKTIETLKNAFKEAGLGNMLDTMSFDDAGTIKSIESLMNKAGSKGRMALEKALIDFKGQIGIDIQIEKQDVLKSQIEDLFSGYELTLELEKLNIPPELMKQIFNVDAISLDDLQAKIIGLKDEFEKVGALKEYESSLRKFADLNAKKIKEDAKTYTEYLLRSKDERIRIEEEVQRKIAEMKATKSFTKPDEEAIEKDIKKEAATKVAQLDYTDLKATDMYKQSFEDLERLGTTTLNIILSELERFAKESGQNLPITEFKELMNNIKGLRNEVESRNPFKELVDSLKEYKEALVELPIAQEAAKKAVLESDVANVHKIAAQEELDTAQEELDTAPEDKKAAALENVIEAQMNLNAATVIATEADRKKAKESANVVTVENRKTAALAKASKAIESQKKAFDTMGNAINQAIDFSKELAEGLGMSFSPETEAIVDSIGKAIGLVSAALGIMLSVILITTIAAGALMATLFPLLAIALALAAVFAIVAIGDAKKEKQIKKEQDKIEALEKSYKKLEKAINGAYSIDTLSKSTELASSNIDQQIVSYEKMIKAEEDKKKTDDDKIKEWRNTIDDLREQQEELSVDLVKTLGGFGDAEAMKSAAQEFSDAWYDAYKETGDGLIGLNESFDAFIDNVVKKQIMLRGVGKMLEPLFQMVDRMFAKDSAGGEKVVREELDKLKEYSDELLPEIDKFLKDLIESLGITGGGVNSELSGLQRGIEGISSEQSDELASLLNSVRFFVADSNLQLKSIADSLLNPDSPNPMLAQLRIIATQTSAINNLLNSLTAPMSRLGGRGLKIIMD